MAVFLGGIKDLEKSLKFAVNYLIMKYINDKLTITICQISENFAVLG